MHSHMVVLLFTLLNIFFVRVPDNERVTTLHPRIWEGIDIPSNARYVEFMNKGGLLPVIYPPPLITHLVFGFLFDRPVNHLPHTLTHISFGKQFNKPVDYLPISLLYLRLGNRFDQPLDHLPVA
jgi:hypothetical protein